MLCHAMRHGRSATLYVHTERTHLA